MNFIITGHKIGLKYLQLWVSCYPRSFYYIYLNWNTISKLFRVSKALIVALELFLLDAIDCIELLQSITVKAKISPQWFKRWGGFNFIMQENTQCINIYEAPEHTILVLDQSNKSRKWFANEGACFYVAYSTNFY